RARSPDASMNPPGRWKGPFSPPGAARVQPGRRGERPGGIAHASSGTTTAPIGDGLGSRYRGAPVGATETSDVETDQRSPRNARNDAVVHELEEPLGELVRALQRRQL